MMVGDHIAIALLIAQLVVARSSQDKAFCRRDSFSACPKKWLGALNLALYCKAWRTGLGKTT
jgi:hypothetical protein